MPRDDKMRTIAFVAYPGLTPLEVVGPMTAFMGLTRGLVSTSREYSTVLVADRVEPVDSDTPMALIPDKAFEDVPDPFARRRMIAPALPSRCAALHGACPGSSHRDATVPEANASDTEGRREDGA
jgi:hypothetical protein